MFSVSLHITLILLLLSLCLCLSQLRYQQQQQPPAVGVGGDAGAGLRPLSPSGYNYDEESLLLSRRLQGIEAALQRLLRDAARAEGHQGTPEMSREGAPRTGGPSFKGPRGPPDKAPEGPSRGWFPAHTKSRRLQKEIVRDFFSL